jgi:hypothetical protein
VRRTLDRPSGIEDKAPWWTVDADVALRAAWSLSGSFDRENADGGALNQAYVGLAYRF